MANYIKALIKSGFLIGLIFFLFMTLIMNLWHQNGFDVIESQMHTFVSAFMYFILCILIPYYTFEHLYEKHQSKRDLNVYIFSGILGVMTISYLIYILLDYIHHIHNPSLSFDLMRAYIDSSLSVRHLSISNIKALYDYPIAIINLYTNLIFGLIGFVTCALLIKIK